MAGSFGLVQRNVSATPDIVCSRDDGADELVLTLDVGEVAAGPSVHGIDSGEPAASAVAVAGVAPREWSAFGSQALASPPFALASINLTVPVYAPACTVHGSAPDAPRDCRSE